MKVSDLLDVTSDFTQVTLLTFWNYETLADSRKGLNKYKDAEIELLTAGTITGKHERKGVICAYVSEEYGNSQNNENED